MVSDDKWWIVMVSAGYCWSSDGWLYSIGGIVRFQSLIFQGGNLIFGATVQSFYRWSQLAWSKNICCSQNFEKETRWVHCRWWNRYITQTSPSTHDTLAYCFCHTGHKLLGCINNITINLAPGHLAAQRSCPRTWVFFPRHVSWFSHNSGKSCPWKFVRTSPPSPISIEPPWTAFSTQLCFTTSRRTPPSPPPMISTWTDDMMVMEYSGFCWTLL